MAFVNTKGPTGPVDFDGYNTSGALIPAFSAVRITGAATHPDDTGIFPTIGLARANLADDMPCIGITTSDIENGATGTVRQFGPIFNIDTSAFSASDLLFVSGTAAGELVGSINPPDYIAQRIGTVLVSDATEGQAFVSLDPMMDGAQSYTIRELFDINSPSTATAALRLTATGGSTQIDATPTGTRILTLPDATTTLVGRDTTDLLTNKTFDVVHINSSGTPSFDTVLAVAETLTADRQLTIRLDDANRTLRITGNVVISGTHSGTNTGDQTITLTGDVTGTGTGSFAATIANNAVSMAKLADIASQTIIGRGDASTGDPAALTLETGIQVTTGEVFKAAGRFLRRTIYTSGSGTHTPGTDCNLMRVICIGGGGGGGGADQAGAGQTGSGAGGAAGAECEKIAANSGTYSYSVGAAGSGGSAGNNAGSDGGDTTFSGTNFSLTGTRGQGGAGGASSATSYTNLGGSGLVATGGDWNGAGQSGWPGMVINGASGIAASGQGGSPSPRGRGGISRTTHGAGVAGVGLGAGGGGATAITTSTPRAGGAGTAGAIIVEEMS